MSHEKEMRGFSGWAMLLLLIVVMIGAAYEVVQSARDASPWGIVLWVAVLVVDGVCLAGLTVVNPNEAKVLQLFGHYVGSAREPGLRWASPFYTKKKVSLRVVSFESGKLKVNDLDGNPVEIAAIVVWRVVDSAQAAFEVSDCAEYVRVQSEAALRNLATRYPYDAHDDETKPQK